MNELIESIKKHEGFVAKPYPDPIHGWNVPTFGHGLTYLTEQESEMIVRNRVAVIMGQLSKAKPVFTRLSVDRQNALIEMAYQLGVTGTLNFKRMWLAIEAGDFEQARLEALDSKWARQTPKRAISVAAKLV
jgi:lysozyme